MAKQAIPIRLPDELELDLRAFGKAHYDAPLSRIVSDAVRVFIDARLTAEPAMRERFEAFRYPPKESEPVLRVLSSKGPDV